MSFVCFSNPDASPVKHTGKTLLLLALMAALSAAGAQTGTGADASANPKTLELRVVAVDPSAATIQRAQVGLRREGSELKTEQIADSEGRVSFSGLPAGNYSVTVWAQGFKTEEQKVRLEGRPATITVTLRVGTYSGPEATPVEPMQSPAVTPNPIQPLPGKETPSPGSKLQILVVDLQGAIPPHAQLTLIDEKTDKKRTTTSDTQGSAEFSEVPSGNYRLVVSARGFATSERHINVNDGVITMTISLNWGTADWGSGSDPVGTRVQVETLDELTNPEIQPYPIEPLPKQKKKKQ